MMVRQRTVTILVVEDDRDIALLLQSAIEEVPAWRAIVVGDGLSALACLRSRPVDVLLLDVNLPGLSGPELLGRLRAEGQWPPATILLSAAGRSPATMACLRRGEALAFLQKPFDLDELLATLNLAAAAVTVAGAAQGLRAA